MIKRMNKVTSLLVAAAAIASIVPATGANAADYKKIDSKEGTIYEAVAYKDGQFYIDGNTKDGDTDGAYYLNDGKYTELENVDSGSDVTGTYGDKYVNIEAGDYFVDLSTGTVADDNLESDNTDDAASALRKVIKANADDRYSDYTDLKTDLQELPGAKFSDTWYQTSYKVTATTSSAVYTDVKGNYIDADYNVGKIKVATATKTASLTNNEDTENGTTVAVSNQTVIGQDANNIYRTATITITSDEVITKINGVDVAGTGFDATVNGGKTVSFTAIQKISKAQASGDVDGAKYAKTVSTYAVSDKDGKLATILANSQKNIVDGKIIAYTNSSEEVTVQTVELKSSNGINYVELTDVDAENAVAVDTDANGNLWRLDGGYIYEFDNDEDWTKVYKVDGSMEKLSVYDKDNMVAWNQDDEVYSLVGDKTVDETPVVTAGWVKAANGTWSYNKADGTKATGWIKDGAWYFLKADGVMATGWVNDGGTWYYLAGSGAMQTGWLNDNGTWYYLNASGAMLSNTTVDGYKLGASGAWIR